jgi:ubiquinone/menaquinone biosynthesis C-methylase UbiE
MKELPPIFFEIHQDLPREGPGKNIYTRQAFEMLPRLEKPRILDVGCGPGQQTLELARLSEGEVVALDMHQPYLDILEKKIEAAGLSDRIETVQGDMNKLDFPEENFDIIWAEGSIFIAGFERGIGDWKKFLKPQGFVCVTEAAWLKENPPPEIREFWEKCYPAITTIAENLNIIRACGYDNFGHFVLPEDSWWDEYYHPLEKRIQMLQEKYRSDKEALAILSDEMLEIDLFRRYSSWYGYIFFLMQKR